LNLINYQDIDDDEKRRKIESRYLKRKETVIIKKSREIIKFHSAIAAELRIIFITIFQLMWHRWVKRLSKT
jgi:hypothetical protein